MGYSMVWLRQPENILDLAKINNLSRNFKADIK